MHRWIALFSLLAYIVPGEPQNQPHSYVPPPTFEHAITDDKAVTEAEFAFARSADRAAFRDAIEKLAISGDVVAQIILANSYAPPECTFAPFKIAPADCPHDVQMPNPMGVTPSFDAAIYWLKKASDQGHGEATEMLAQLTERAIRSGSPGLQMADVTRLHAVARSQGFDLQDVEYRCYALEPGGTPETLSMAAKTHPEFAISQEQLALLHDAGVSGKLQLQISSSLLSSGLQHPEGPRVQIRVIVGPPVTRDVILPLPDRADVLYLQQADRVITLPSAYPTSMRSLAFRPASKSETGGVFYQRMDGTFQEICSSPTPPLPSGTNGQNPIEDFFSDLAAARFIGQYGDNTAFGKLTTAIETMTPAQIAAGVPVIDRVLDNPVEPADQPGFSRHEVKGYACSLFIFIGRRPDGPALLTSQTTRLASMLNDPENCAVTALQTIYRDRPDLLVPIFEAPLRAPEVAHPGGMGVAPVLAALLLYMHLPGDQVINEVARYIGRPELADDELLYTIESIDKLKVIPDALTEQLVRSLDRPNEQIKIQALIGITKSNPSAKNAARPRIEKMANDPNETPNVRRAAMQALTGQINEN